MYLRLIGLIFKWLTYGQTRQDFFSPCSTRFTVGLMDLDLNFHMNNGRYFSIMDLGRFDLLKKCGMFGPLMKEGYYPVVVSESIRFKRSLELFHKLDLVTQVESWDDKDFFLSQKFNVKGQTYAVGYIKGRFRKRGQSGSVPTQEIFDRFAVDYQGQRVSALAMAQNEVEKELNRKIMETKDFNDGKNTISDPRKHGSLEINKGISVTGENQHE